MQYVYGCSQDKTHPRYEVSHGMLEVIRVACQKCGAPMHKVPQPFRWGQAPGLVLVETLEERYRKNTHRRKLSR